MSRRAEFPTLYRRWCWIQQATKNPNSPDYHYAHKMKFAWQDDYEGFEDYILNTLGEPWSGNCYLVRINPQRGWVPGNLEFTTSGEAAPKRSCSMKLRYQGRTQNAYAWAQEFGMTYWTFLYRLHQRGMTMREIHHTPNARTGQIYATK